MKTHSSSIGFPAHTPVAPCKANRARSAPPFRVGARSTVTIALMVASTSLAGCYHYHVQPRRVPSATEPETRTGWSFLWGFVQPEDVVPECPPGIPLARVATHTNYLYVLLGTVTLGIVLPQELEWQCATPSNNVVDAVDEPTHHDDDDLVSRPSIPFS